MDYKTGYVWIEANYYMNFLFYFYKGVLIEALYASAPDPAPGPFPVANVKPQPLKSLMVYTVGGSPDTFQFYRGVLMANWDTNPLARPQDTFTGTAAFKVHTDTNVWEDVDLEFVGGALVDGPLTANPTPPPF